MKRKLCFINKDGLLFSDVARGYTKLSDGKYDRYNLFFSLALSRHQKEETPGESGVSSVFRSQQLKHNQLIPQPVKQIQPDNSRTVQIDDLLCL